MTWISSVAQILAKVPRRELIIDGPVSWADIRSLRASPCSSSRTVGFPLNTWLGVVIGLLMSAGSRLFSPEEQANLSRAFGPARDDYPLP